MKTKLSLAVASALLAVASSANAGITIPAGDWTVDIGGNVNAYYIHNNSSDTNTVAGGLANTKTTNAVTGYSSSSSSAINTGLLPSWLGISAKTRENDLDVAFTVSFQPGASSLHALQGGGGSEFRQAFLTFGDKSWGSIKLGKDLGVFGSDAILNDQTLLGVGSQGLVGTGGGTTTTLGRIGTGFLYADFKGQINYTSPNWGGFSFVGGIAQPWDEINLSGFSATSAGGQKQPGFEGKASYEWAGDFSGKVWLEGLTQKVDNLSSVGTTSSRGQVGGLGGKVGFAGAELVGYYYTGEGVGTTALFADGFSAAGHRRDSDGGYVQLAYVVPGIGTKVAGSWGESNLDSTAGDPTTLVKKNEMWTLGVYHPLTKHVNLVAEYSNVKAKNNQAQENTSNIVDLGAILFF